MRSEDRVEERRFLKRIQQQKREEEMQEALENVAKNIQSTPSYLIIQTFLCNSNWNDVLLTTWKVLQLRIESLFEILSFLKI